MAGGVAQVESLADAVFARIGLNDGGLHLHTLLQERQERVGIGTAEVETVGHEAVKSLLAAEQAVLDHLRIARE